MQTAKVELAEKETKAMLNRASAMLAMRRAQNVQADTAATMQELQSPIQDDGMAAQMGQLEIQRATNEEQAKLNREKFEFDKRLKLSDHRMKVEQQFENEFQARLNNQNNQPKPKTTQETA